MGQNRKNPCCKCLATLNSASNYQVHFPKTAVTFLQGGGGFGGGGDGGGGGGFFLTCEDLGRMFDHSFHTCGFFF